MLSANSLPVFPNSQKNWQSWSSPFSGGACPLPSAFSKAFSGSAISPLALIDLHHVSALVYSKFSVKVSKLELAGGSIRQPRLLWHSLSNFTLTAMTA
jgi:hypothetical protein